MGSGRNWSAEDECGFGFQGNVTLSRNEVGAVGSSFDANVGGKRRECHGGGRRVVGWTGSGARRRSYDCVTAACAFRFRGGPADGCLGAISSGWADHGPFALDLSNNVGVDFFGFTLPGGLPDSQR